MTDIRKTLRWLSIFLLGFVTMPFVLGAESDTWITEEVLRQLQEIRQEIGDLRQEVAGLSSRVTTISSGNPDVTGNVVAGVVTINDQPVLGDEDATLAIVEFTDFQCPYCYRHSQSVYSEIKSQFIDSGEVKYIVRDFPLSIHPLARGAAIAANCAGEQGGYWQAHDELFANMSLFGRPFYLTMAEKLGLDAQEFERCLDDPRQLQEVEADLAYGTSVGVRGTPSFLIGRISGDEIVDVIQLQGAQPYSAFASAIERLSQ